MRAVKMRIIEPADAAWIAPHMRGIDILEAWHLTGIEAEQALRMTIAATPEPVAGWIDGKLVAAWGVIPRTIACRTGIPWLVATDAMEGVWMSFLTLSEAELEEVAEGYDVLTNFVWVENEKAIRWLQWLGFEMVETVYMGAEHAPFYRFEKRIPAPPADEEEAD